MTYEDHAIEAALDAHADAIRPGVAGAELREAARAVAREVYRTAMDDAAGCLDDMHGTFGGDMLRAAREEVLHLPDLDPADLDDGDFLRCPQNGSGGFAGGHGTEPLPRGEPAEVELPF